jgi:hypothetical protein
VARRPRRRRAAACSTTSPATTTATTSLHHLYKHPLQPILDALTVADLGATAGVKPRPLLSGERAALVTRSPRAIATGKGPVTPTSRRRSRSSGPRASAREQGWTKHPEGIKGVGGELKAYGKQIQAEANQHALGP